MKYFWNVSKITKTLVFFLRTSGEYSKRYGQGSVFTTDSCPYLVKYSLNFLKNKTKVLDISNTEKQFHKNNRKSSPKEIWIRIRFLEINRYPSLNKTQSNFTITHKTNEQIVQSKTKD